jgi:hypothetical protein
MDSCDYNNLYWAYCTISTITSGIFAYLWHRKKEISSLLLEIVKDVSDEDLTDEEIQRIIKKLRMLCK